MHLSQTYDQYEIKVDQNKAAENGILSQLAMHLNKAAQKKRLRLLKKMVELVDVKVKQNKQTDWSEDKLNND